MDFPKTVANVNLLNGEFTDGNPSGGTPASLVPAEWLNNVTNEILNVLAKAGIAADETSSNQLITALLAMFIGSGSGSSNGYFKVPYVDQTSGLIKTFVVQFGSGNGSTSGPATFNFPITFPTACLGFAAITVNPASYAASLSESPSQQSFSMNCWGMSGTPARSTSAFIYIAIGN